MTDSKRGLGRPPRSRIQQGLVGDRSLVGTRYLADPILRSEYVRDIAPRTAVALGKILRETFPDPGAREHPLRVLDLGAGTGAAGAAVRAHFGNDTDLSSVDQIPAAGVGHVADITKIRSLSQVKRAGRPFDLLIAAHVLNELYLDETPLARPGRLAALVADWCRFLLTDLGTMIVVEPALRETSRALLAVRDHLVISGLRIVAPCFFAGPCPALLRERDWCHDAAASHDVGGEKLAARGILNRGPAGSSPAGKAAHRVDFTYLVIRRSGDPPTDPTLLRIVSDPLPEKGRLKLFGCGLSGRQPIVRLDRHASAANADFDQLKRGDVVRIERATFAADGMRVVPDSTVARKTRAR
jgi:hypothetical protein